MQQKEISRWLKAITIVLALMGAVFFEFVFDSRFFFLVLLFYDKFLLVNSNNKILCKQSGAICHLFFCLQRILLFTVHFIIFLYSFINSFRNLFKIFIVCSIVNIVLFPLAIFQLLLQFFLLGNPA